MWVGNASGAPMHAVSGVTGAAPVWRTLMDALQRSEAASPAARARLTKVAYAPPPAAPFADAPAPPPGVVAQAIDFAGGLEAPRTEWFLPGTETPHVALASAAGSAGRAIASPDDRSLIAIDPDIPPAVQRVRFEALHPPAGSAWRLDGKRLGPARPLPWSPWPGQHVLELLDAKGGVVDTVSFEVRGAQVRNVATGARAGARR